MTEEDERRIRAVRIYKAYQLARKNWLFRKGSPGSWRTAAEYFEFVDVFVREVSEGWGIPPDEVRSVVRFTRRVRGPLQSDED